MSMNVIRKKQGIQHQKQQKKTQSVPWDAGKENKNKAMKMNKDEFSCLLKNSELRFDSGLKRQNQKTFCFGRQTFSDLNVIFHLFPSDCGKTEEPSQWPLFLPSHCVIK